MIIIIIKWNGLHWFYMLIFVRFYNAKISFVYLVFIYQYLFLIEIIYIVIWLLLLLSYTINFQIDLVDP